MIRFLVLFPSCALSLYWLYVALFCGYRFDEWLPWNGLNLYELWARVLILTIFYTAHAVCFTVLAVAIGHNLWSPRIALFGNYFWSGSAVWWVVLITMYRRNEMTLVVDLMLLGWVASTAVLAFAIKSLSAKIK